MSPSYRSSAYYNTASSLWPCEIYYVKVYRLSACLPFSTRNRAFIFTCFFQLTQAPLCRITYLSQPDQLIGKKSRLLSRTSDLQSLCTVRAAVVSWNINTQYYLSSFVSYPIPGNETLNVGIANNQTLKNFVFDAAWIRSALFRPE